VLYYLVYCVPTLMDKISQIQIIPHALNFMVPTTTIREKISICGDELAYQVFH
jgi:hypothetical protein